MKKCALLLCFITGCGGADFNAIPQAAPPDASDSDAGIDVQHDASSMSDAVETGTSSDSSNLDVLPESTALDMGPDVAQEDVACTPITHVNGLGQGYQSCAPLGTPGDESTYTYAMGALAALAWPQGTGVVGDSNCITSGTFSSACRLMLSNNPPNAATWCYTGPLAGYVAMGSDNPTIPCPTTSSSTWN